MHVSNLDEFIAFVADLGFEVETFSRRFSGYTDIFITGYGISHMISFPVLRSSQDLSPADRYLCYEVSCLLRDISLIAKIMSV